MMRQEQQLGFSLIELLAAIIIAATVAVVGISHLREPSESGKQRSCELTRQTLQNEVQRFKESTGALPSTDLRQLNSPEYWGTDLPTCPVTGEKFRLGRDGRIECPTHK